METGYEPHTQERGCCMKILQVIDSLGLGGAEVLVTNLYAGFSERGIDCEYYLLHSEKTHSSRV
jgi:hypothetical protein